MAELTEEQKAVNDKRTAKAKAKREANRAIIKTYFEEDGQKRADKQVPLEVKQAILTMAGMGERAERSTGFTALRALLVANGTVSAIEIFTAFEFGRPTMQKHINTFIKADADKRIWVDFAEGNYTIVGTGENAPEGWTGYLPTEKAEL